MDYKYYAFISYSRKDEKYAKWIQEKLESYKLPSKIAHDNPDLRKGVRPIFRDKTDLGAGVLYESLGKELAASQYLIVISSPTSAKSEWVEKETREFLKTHTPDYIIPLVVEGIPNSNDENECFNPAIKEITPEILGINIQENGKQQALTKVVAKLLNLSYDALWQRHKRQEKRKKIIFGVCVALLLVAGLFVWDYNRPKYQYYADIAEYADGWLPKGIVKLSKEQMKHRNQTYRFVYKQHILHEVAKVNSYGKAVDDIMLFVHPDKKGSKPVIQHLNKSRDISYMEEFSGENFDRIDFMFPPEKGGGAFGVKSQTNRWKASEIRRIVLTRNADGFVVRKVFKRYPGLDAVSACDDNGIFGYEYEVDDLGQVLAIYYLDNTKSRVPLKNGMASVRYIYDARGNVLEEQYLDAQNKLFLTNENGAEICRSYDQYGNNVEESHYDAEENRYMTQSDDRYAYMTSTKGYATVRTKYDDKGNAIEIAYYDVQDSLCMSSDNVAIITKKYDDEGNEIEINYFNPNKEPCYDKWAAAKITYKYDKRGNIVEYAYFGIDGKPCLNSFGFAKSVSKYDERGNTTEVAYYGVDDKPCQSNNGYAKITHKYDERGNEIEFALWGIDGKPCLMYGWGFAKWTNKYDERGNVIEAAFYGVDGKPCLCDGCAKRTSKYDDCGNLIEYATFGVDGNPCLRHEIAKYTSKYDKRGNEIETAYFGVDGEPCLNYQGIAKSTSKRDERGKTIEEAYYGIDGNPCLSKDGYAKSTYKYDGRENIIEEAYFGIDGRPCLNRNGYAICAKKYDKCGNLIEKAYYGVDGSLIKSDKGYAKITCQFDEKGRLTEEAYYNQKGDYCSLAKVIQRFDKRGGLVEKSFWGADGKLRNCDKGYARMICEYDGRGNVLSETYWNAAGARCMMDYKWTRYPAGNTRYVISGEDPLPLENGYSRFEGKYDDRNKLTKVTYYDEKDNEILVVKDPKVVP